MNREYIITFYTHYGAQRLYRRMIADGMSARLMPVPRCLSSSCGTCVHYNGLYEEWITKAEDIEGIYEITGEEYVEVFKVKE